MGSNNHLNGKVSRPADSHSPLRWQRSELLIGDSVVPLSVTRTGSRQTIALSVHPGGEVTVVALGYSRDVDLGDRVRDLMGLRIADGTTDVMRMTVVREKYGYDLWKMAVGSYKDDSAKSDEAADVGTGRRKVESTKTK